MDGQKVNRSHISNIVHVSCAHRSTVSLNKSRVYWNIVNHAKRKACIAQQACPGSLLGPNGNDTVF